MNESNNDYCQPTDKDLLKKNRKERKKIKKETKRCEKVKERERQLLEIKLGPKDSRIKIITKNAADHISKTSVAHNGSPSCSLAISKISLAEVQLKDSDTGPDEIPVYANLSANPAPAPYNKRAKSDLVQIGFMDMLLKSESPTKLKYKDAPVKQYSGNILDSDQPEHKKGKHREIPKKKHPTKLKSVILKEKTCDSVNTEYEGIHSPDFETYCNNYITNQLNDTVKLFLSNIVKFQEKFYEREPFKGVVKRRYVVGFREIHKYLLANKLKIIIIAPNIKTLPSNGALDTTVNNLIRLAEANNIPYIFALTRRILGRITLKYIPVSCVGIFNYDGTEDTFKIVLKHLQEARDLYSSTSSPENLEKATTGLLTQTLQI